MPSFILGPVFCLSKWHSAVGKSKGLLAGWILYPEPWAGFLLASMRAVNGTELMELLSVWYCI